MERLHGVLASVADQSRRAQFRALAHEQLDILTGDYPEVGTIFSAQGWWPEVHDQARKSMRREHDAIFRGVLEAGIVAGEFHCEDVDVALQCHHAIMNNVSAWLGRIEDPVAAQGARSAVVNAVMRVVDAADDDSPQPKDTAR
jgi:hypothetical protein